MRSAPAFPPRRDRQGAWTTGAGRQRIHASGVGYNIGATGVQLAQEGEGLASIYASNNSGALMFVQVFLRRESEIILGTTPPDFVLAVPDNNNDSQEWDAPLACPRGARAYATTTRTGATPTATGHNVSATIVCEGEPGDDAPRQSPTVYAFPRTSSPGSRGYRYGDVEP